jgi:hypothetical protein
MKGTLKVANRGTLLLSNNVLIEKLGFKQGDRFIVSKRKDGIILKKDKEGD